MTDDAPAIRLEPPQDLRDLPRARLLEMDAAAGEVATCMRVLRKAGMNLVGEVLKGQGTFVKLAHYPKGDVLDAESHSQYYYHAHRGGEHGHFHLFLRAGGMAPGAAPLAGPAGEAAIAHLVAISMDRQGVPVGLFTTNRWVTDESWFPGPQVAAMVDRFDIDHAWPAWPTNRWLGAMLRLFHPQVMALIAARDRAMADHAAAHPGAEVFEDRSLEVLSEVAIDLAAQGALIRAALEGGGG